MILAQNHKIVSLEFYLKMIGENVNPYAYITFPKTDRRLDRYIFVGHEFCTKTHEEMIEGEAYCLSFSFSPFLRDKVHGRLMLIFFFFFFFKQQRRTPLFWKGHLAMAFPFM
jgi:hypothetical protein